MSTPLKRLVAFSALLAAGLGTAYAIAGPSAANASCDPSRAEALLAKRIIGSAQSYRKDNPQEYLNVRAYLDGGSRPSTAGMTHMGLHLVYLEDTCRAVDVTTTVTGTTTITTTVTQPTTTTTTTPPPPSGLTITAPAQGTTVSGQVTVRATDSDSRVTWVGFYPCDGDQSYEDHVPASGVWEILWDSTTCANGTRNMGVYAFNDAGTIIHQVENWSLNVQNGAPPPPPPPPPPDCDPASTPAPISGLGYTVRFKDCFSILDRSVWCDNQWWEPNPVAGSQTVSNGELRLRRARVDGYRDTTMTTEPCGQANPKSFQYGYFEARMRHETVQGNGPAFWLFSTAHATNPNWPNPKCPNPLCLSAELDVFEGFGTINYGGTRTDDFFSGTIHRNSCDCYGVSNQSRFVQRGTGLDMSQYHVYAARWTPTNVSFYIDGVLQGSVASFDSFAQPMHLLLYNWTTEWEDENVPNASTQPELDVFVDWVRVWQQ